MPPLPKSIVFLPLLALTGTELAPPVDAASADRSRGSSVSSSSGSRSSGSVGRSSGGSRSSGSTGRSSGGSSRSSGSTGRSSGGSSRSSGSIGRSSGSSSRSSGLFDRSSSGSRSSGLLDRSSGDSSGLFDRSGSRSSGLLDRSSGGSSRSSGLPLITGTAASPSANAGSSGTGRTRFVAPTPAPSYADGATTRSLDASGEAYAPRLVDPVPFPAPSSSGRTTYARRFAGGDEFGGRAASTTGGGTLGTDGVGSVTSAIAAERRALAARGFTAPDPLPPATARGTEARIRSPHSPGGRFRQAIAQQDLDRRRTFAGLAGSPSALDTTVERSTGRGPGRTSLAAGDAAGGTLAGAAAGHTAEATRRGTRAEARPGAVASPEGALRRRMAGALDPERSRLVSTLGRGASVATGTAVAAATRPLVGAAGADLIAAPFVGDHGATGPGYGDDYGDGYTGSGSDFPTYHGYGFGWWDSYGNYHPPYSYSGCSWWGWGFGWSTSWGLHFSYGWDWWDCYGWSWGPTWCPPYAYYPQVVHHYAYDPVVVVDDPDPVHVYVYDDDEPVGEAVYVDAENVYLDADDAWLDADDAWLDDALLELEGSAGQPLLAPAAPAPEPAPSPIGAAGLRYLELGDAAFTEQRYTDAVYFYSRAVDFEPDQGMLHLVLADALFATGDYHAAAHRIRRALELEPGLVSAPVDKHQFYADPTDFDRQLAALELYVEEHPLDVDARLVLALNQLFGGRPLAALELIDGSPSTARGTDAAADLIRAAADQARWGDAKPVEAGWPE